MNEWQTQPLRELCDPDRGITYGIVKVGEFVTGGVPVIRGGDIRNNAIVFEDHKRVSPDVSSQFARTILRGGEILINLISEPGHVAVVPPSLVGANVSRDVGVIPLLPEVDREFVRHFLTSPACINWLESRLQGSVTQKINLSTLRELPIPRPPRDFERSSSTLLSALDDKIESNRRINETLEAMARALFRDWFVDFGPTRAKMAGIAPYLSADLWSLFPDRLADEGRPEGWEEKPLDEIANFLNGLALQKFPGENEVNSLPVIKIAELRNGITAKSNRASHKVPSQYVIQDGDFLFSWSGSLLAKFWTGGEGALNQHLFKVSSDCYPAWFFSEWVQHHLEEFQIIAASKATTMGHIQRGHLKAATTICPPDPIIERLGDIIAPLIDRMIHNELETRTLAQTRDLLLPRLMSGELRVSEATLEREVEA